MAAAGAHSGVTAVLGDARHLPEPDASADAVLLLGPLYHLPERADRVAAWREAARVVRPGGVVTGAVISRFASLFDGVRPEDLAAEAADAGLTGVRTVGVEGPVWTTGTRLTGIMLDMLRRIEAEPSLLGASSHLLTITRRPAP